MARRSLIPIPGSIGANDNGTTASLSAVTASSAIVLGTGAVFAINASQDLTITFGVSGSIATPSATVGFRIPANVTMMWDLDAADRFMIFNSAASAAATYSYIPIKVV